MARVHNTDIEVLDGMGGAKMIRLGVHDRAIVGVRHTARHCGFVPSRSRSQEKMSPSYEKCTPRLDDGVQLIL